MKYGYYDRPVASSEDCEISSFTTSVIVFVYEKKYSNSLEVPVDIW